MFDITNFLKRLPRVRLSPLDDEPSTCLAGRMVTLRVGGLYIGANWQCQGVNFQVLHVSIFS